MATSKKGKSNPELALQIHNWATHNHVASDVFVTGITGALETGANLDYWARYDALDLLPYPQHKSGQREAVRVERLINFRNIMVFVPVAFTWAGISQATGAFSIYSELNPNKIANFFDFWENGYGVLNKFWTLSSVARIDFFLLALIIASSITIAFQQGTIKKLGGKEKSEIEQERMKLALDINQFLHSHREITPLVLNQNLISSIRDLKKTSDSIAKILKSSEKSAVELSRGSVIREQLKDLKKQIEKLHK